MEYKDIIKDIASQPKDLFVDTLLVAYGESFNQLTDVRTCFHTEALKHDLPGDKVLVKRRKGELAVGARRLALDCYLLHSFITQSSSLAELKEVFSKSASNPHHENLQDTDLDASSYSPVARHGSLPELYSGLSQVTAIDNATKCPSVLLTDTLAQMKEDILSFKQDMRADYDALQTQIDEMTQEKNVQVDNGKVSDINNQTNECITRIKNVEKDVEKSNEKISNLMGIIERRTQRISDLESELKKARSECCVLKQQVESNARSCCKDGKTIKEMSTKIYICHELVAKCYDGCKDKYNELKGKCKAMKTDANETDKYIRDVQGQLDSIRWPSEKVTSSLKSEIKVVKDLIKGLEDDIHIHDKKIEDYKHEIKSIRKECEKKTGKLSKSYAEILQAGKSKEVSTECSNQTDSKDDRKRSDEKKKNVQQSTYDPKQKKPESGTKRNQQIQKHNEDECENFYIGNIGSKIKAKDLAVYLQKKEISVHTVHILPSKIEGCVGAKITIEKGHKKMVTSINFFPGQGVYARRWYP